jgi:hypothetical protein
MYNGTRIAYIVFENAADATRLIKSIEKFRADPNLEETEKTKAEGIAALYEQGQLILTNLFKSSRKRQGNNRMHVQSSYRW